MKRFIFGLLVTAGVLAGCTREGQPVSTLRIAPKITRVTGLHFDPEDRIGLTVTRATGAFVTNQMMTYDGSYFTSPDFLWYKELDEASTLTAYYPYDEKGAPAEFSVAADQTAGCEASNLLVAVKTDVRPTASAVGMTFASVMADVRISVINETEAAVTGITVSGTCLTAEIDFRNRTATAKAGVAASGIKAFPMTAGTLYEVILVPQTAPLTFTAITGDGETCAKTLPESVLESNKQYTVSMKLTAKGLDLTLSGDIENWQPGGELGETKVENVLDYQGEQYRTVEINGRVWMAENLRWIPNENLLNAGVWYPSLSGQACCEADYIKEKGMLYDYSTATGGVVTYTDGYVRGICPEGWHIPGDDDFSTLLQASVPEDFAVGGGYWMESQKTYYSGGIKGFLLGVTNAAESGKHNYLSLEDNTITKIVAMLEKNGVSLRCVKDAR